MTAATATRKLSLQSSTETPIRTRGGTRVNSAQVTQLFSLPKHEIGAARGNELRRQVNTNVVPHEQWELQQLVNQALDAYLEYSRSLESKTDQDYLLEEKKFIANSALPREVKEAATHYVAMLASAFSHVKSDSSAMPGLSEPEQGILVEWRLPNSSLGLFFDKDLRDSSYYIVTDDPKSGITASGYINQISQSLLVELFVDQFKHQS